MDPYHYENMQDPRSFPILPPPYLHHHPAVLGESRMRGGGRRRPGAKLSTDPQSVAARERRHRISDRFRVLRSLVPGGSKMDTVTMLEQAIHYVKFLKAQVSLHQAALMHHEEGCGQHELAAAGRGADDEGAAVPQLPGVPVHEVAGYHSGAHQMQLLGGHDLGQMSSSAHELPPLPSCVFDDEYSCYSECNLHSEEADDVHGSY